MLSDIRASKGFTLIELLVVIAIIGILSSVVLASLSTARTKGKVAAFKAEANSLRTQGVVACDGGTSATPITFAASTFTLPASTCASEGTFSITISPTDAAINTGVCASTIVNQNAVNFPATCK